MKINSFCTGLPLLVIAALIPLRVMATVVPAPPIALSASSPENLAAITLIGNNRQTMGRVAITETPRGVLLQLEVRGLMSGWHGVHIHSIGDCSDEASFNGAGPPLAASGESHGFIAANGPHKGDFPNVWVGQDGIGRAQFFNALLTRADLHGVNGSTVIIMDAEDDFRTEPAAQTGKRVSCGVIATRQPQKSDTVAPPANVQPP